MADGWDELRREMTITCREQIGSGYVPDYYRQLAEDYVQTAIWLIEKREQNMVDRSTTRVRIAACPACKTDILADCSFEFERQDVDYDNNKIALHGKITGARVFPHDCIPKIHR